MATEKTPQTHRDSTNTPALDTHGTWGARFKSMILVPLVVFIVLALIGQVLEVSTNQYIQLVLLYMCANMIFAVSLNLVNGFTGQFSIGHAGFMAVGAYTSAYLSTAIFPNPAFPMYIAFAIAGGLAAAAAGYIVGLPSLRLRGDYLAIVTLGFGEIIRVILLNMPAVGGARGLSGIPRPTQVELGDVLLTPFYLNYLLAVFWVIVTVTFMWRLVHSIQGRAFLSVREDEIAAQSMGINTTRVKVRAFVISAFFAGIAGSVFAHSAQFLSPATFGFTKSVDAIIMVVLGGMGSITGSVFAAVFVTLLPEFILRPLTDLTGVDLRMVIYSLALILFMILRPEGILERANFLISGDVMAAEANNVILDASNVTMQFGGLKAVDNFNLQLRHGELAGLIGPNGAGKTTVFNVLTGVYKPTIGSVHVAGVDTAPLKPYKISHLGVSRTFQNIRLFRELTVLDNVLIAANQHAKHGLVDSVLRLPRYYREEARLKQQSLELLSIFGLERKALDEAGSLPYGEQRKLEIIRALATEPKVLFLDEPAAGMNHKETHELMETIAKIRKDFGLTVLLIEHDMKLVMGICERILVLDHGVTISQGVPELIRKDPNVIKAYLGADFEEGGH